MGRAAQCRWPPIALVETGSRRPQSQQCLNGLVESVVNSVGDGKVHQLLSAFSELFDYLDKFSFRCAH